MIKNNHRCRNFNIISINITKKYCYRSKYFLKKSVDSMTFYSCSLLCRNIEVRVFKSEFH